MYNYSDLKKNQKAVSLKYDKEKEGAPKVTNSGKGVLARRIIEIARQNNVPIHKDEDLVEILSLLEVNEAIPIEIYSVVAKIFTYIYKQNKEKSKQEQNKKNYE